MTLTPLDLVLTLGFLGLTVLISAGLGLGLTRQWLTAGTRTILQLAGLGYLLAIAGDDRNILWALAITAAIIALGVFNIYKQVEDLPRWVYGAIALALGSAITFSTAIIVVVILGPTQWDSPLLWFAIAAAIATPASHGTAQTALNLYQALIRQQRQQSQTSLQSNQPHQPPQKPASEPDSDWVSDWDWGDASESDAADNAGPPPVKAAGTIPPRATLGDHKRRAIRQGVTPILNGLMTAGITTIPLFLSGQLLGQIPPLTAVSLQITTLFAAAFTTVLGAASTASIIAIAFQILVQDEIIR
ncbi:MAG: ABC transporter permease [Cyanobacteria bacterium P01_D01_bin.73]